MAERISRISVTVSLRRLFPSASFVGCADIRVAAATCRSQDCEPNMLFAAIPGTKADGLQFVDEALQRGASALLVEKPQPGITVPQCIVPNVRKAYAQLAAALVGYPSNRLRLVGVTGTNGKTTVSWLVRSILQATGERAGLLGTIEYNDGLQRQTANLTTPDSGVLSDWLAAMVQQKTNYAVIEVSSHALHQDRIAGTQLDAAVVTNVTQDHFDYHHDYQSYFSSKARILESIKRGGLTVLNADDPGSSAMQEHTDPVERQVVTYGLEQSADFSATLLEESLAGTRFVIHHGTQRAEVNVNLVGRHNVSNCLAAAAAVSHFGFSLEEVARGVETLHSVPGRLERIDNSKQFEVFVDYAHTHDALRRALQALRPLTGVRLICVFGAGGDRDRAKRPLLGKAATQADLAVVTSDNPRTEDPQAIIEDILPGLQDAPRPPHVEVDRAAAIRWAVQEAQPGDCILIAGKGHETEQIIGDKKFPFDDRTVAREALLRETFLLPAGARRVGA